MSGYTAFARYYDALTSNIDYGARARYFQELLCLYSASPPQLVLDLACGTGSLSFELQRLGYEVIGADASSHMLSVAMTKAYGLEPNERPVFLNQKMEKLDLYGTVDATICALDSVNHIENETRLSEVFNRVSLFTNPDGIFIFDANTLYKHCDVLSNNAFIYDLTSDSHGVYCVWQNSYDERDSHVDISLDFFEKTRGASYRRTSETFSEYYYSDEVFSRLLLKAGFEKIAIIEDNSLDSGDETQRLVYVSKKMS